MVQNRTSEFIIKSVQKASQRSSKKVTSLKKIPAKPVTNFGEKLVLTFLGKVEQINARFAAIDKAITNVISLQSSILEFSETDEKLYSSYDEIKTEIITQATNLNNLEKAYDPKDFPCSQTELRICNTQVLTLKKKLGSIVFYYFTIQEEYKEKCKARLRRQAQIAGVDLSKINLDTIMSRNTEIFLKKAILDYNVGHYYLSEIKKRHEEFKRIELSIEKLRDLFFDLALVLQVDFTLIDRVDHHSFAINRIIAEAKDNAQHYKSGMRLKKCKKFLVFGLLGMVLVVGIALAIVFF